MTTVAIMQPYFFPYAGYYRLLALADIFVILDCVQFPRRGWVHRNKLSKQNGHPDWFTLPIKKPSYDSLISSLRFSEDAKDRFFQQSRAFPHLSKALNNHTELGSILLDLEESVVDYLERTLTYTSAHLGYSPSILRSSSLNIASNKKGQQRIEAIAEKLQAHSYINLEGGIGYYHPQGFESKGIALKIFTPYTGPKTSILERLLTEDIADIRDEINHQLNFIDLAD